MFVGNRVRYSCSEYHIEHGEVGSPQFCPLAIAITAKTPGAEVAKVLGDGRVEIYATRWKDINLTTGRVTRFLKFKLGSTSKVGHLSEEAMEWMRTYDETGKGAPIEFEVAFS